jgi:hypothetical protein
MTVARAYLPGILSAMSMMSRSGEANSGKIQ